MQVIRQIFALLLIVALGYGLYLFAVNKKGAENKLTPSLNGTITFVGSVFSNQSTCDTGNCFLLVKNDKNTVSVIYNTGDKAFCGNEMAAVKGRSITQSTQVKVYGYYAYENNQNVIRTCSDSAYYIQTY